jgi:nucleoside-diphosphate-sugar epimerase
MNERIDNMNDRHRPTELLALKWAMRYGTPEVEDFDDVDDACLRALYAADAGDESLEGIEVWDGDENHYLIGRDDALRRGQRLEEQRRAGRPPAKPIVATVRIVAPDGTDVGYENYESERDAHADANRLRAVIGAERVRVVIQDRGV